MARFRVEIPMVHMAQYPSRYRPLIRQWLVPPDEVLFTATLEPTRDVLVVEGDAPQDVVTLFMALARGEWPM